MKNLKFFFIAVSVSALAIACGKGGSDTDKPAGQNSDENGIASLTIREKGKGEYAAEIDITVGVKESASIEYKVEPSSASIEPRFESKETSIAYATQQGTVRGRRAGKTQITLSVNGKVYATANVTVVEPSDESQDPSAAPSEKIRLDDSHWYFYCLYCDEYEPIKEASEHAAANHYATWYPYSMNLVLMEDTEDMMSYLSYEDYEGNPTYSYTVGPDTYYNFDDGAGDGIFFDLDPSAPYPQIYSTSVPDPFCHGSLTVSFENERYIAGPYTCEAQYRGLIGFTPEVDITLYAGSDVIVRSLIHNNKTEISPKKGGEFSARVTWPAFDGGEEKGLYAHRDFAETGYDYFYVTSSNPDVVSVESMGSSEGERWEASFKCNSVGAADLKFYSHITKGVSNPVWTYRVNVR